MKKSFTIKLEKKEWEEILDKVFQKKKKTVNVSGFRKGNVPKDIYIKKFGIESLYMDAVDQAMPIAYGKLLEENKDLEPACAPGVDIKNITPEEIEFEFQITEKPEVKLGKYKELGIKKEKVTVTDEEIEHELGHLVGQFADLKIKDEKNAKVENGDIAVIDFEGFKDGKPFDGGKSEGYSLEIGSHSFIPGFEEGVIGMKIGESKDINLTFPKDYMSEELKGKDVVFKVKVNEIKTRVLPEMNEDFFKDLGMPEVNSEKELKDAIKKDIEAHKSHHVEDEYVEKCLETVSKNAKVDVPEEMINEEIDRMIREFSQQVQMQGIRFEDYIKMTGMDESKLRENMKEEASKRVNYRLVIDAVSKEEKIKVSSKEVDEYVKELAGRYQMSEEDLLKNVGSKDVLEYDLKVKKAIELITK